MSDQNLGYIRFVRQTDGWMGLGQHWNPSQITRDERDSIAQVLREIADAIDRDEFEDKNELKHFPCVEST